MISAARFFQDHGGGGEEYSGLQNDRYSRWKRLSQTCWRVEREASSPRSHSPQHHAALDRLLTRQSSSPTHSDGGIVGGIPPPMTLNGVAVSDGMIAGISVDGVGVQERDRWVLDVESFLKKRKPSTVDEDDDREKETEKASTELCHNRHEVEMSSPLRLSAKTLAPSLLDPSEDFCLAGLSALGANSSAPLEFSSFGRGGSSSSAYVPAGYEDVETKFRLQEEKKEETQRRSSNVYYIVEIRDKKGQSCPTNAQTTTTLEEIGLIWKDTGASSPGGTLQFLSEPSLSAMGIKVKLISSTALMSIVSQEAVKSSGADLMGILSELEATAPLKLPQRVGYGVDNTLPSLVLVVSLDPLSAGEHSMQHRFMAQLQESISEGHIVLRFNRSDMDRENPLSNQLSFQQFVIGRHVQIVNHPSSEEEHVQKALEAALWNAERFVPDCKRLQWEQFADVLLMVLPHPALPTHIAAWLRGLRRSEFDPSLANLLLHLPYWQQWTPPACHYVDKHTMINAAVWHHIQFAQSTVARMVTIVKENSDYYKKTTNAGVVDARTLYKLCTDLESGRLCFHRSRRAKLRHCTAIHHGYLNRMLTALKIERLRCYEDMKKHDMYSIHWKGHIVEIPPPLTPRSQCQACAGRKAGPFCAYHLAALHVEDEMGKKPPAGKPIAIRTKKQLERFPLLLWTMSAEDSLVVRVTVPGVAEDFPLVSIGDLVRLHFRTPDLDDEDSQGMSTEVVAEVVDVVVKTEEVTIRLPSPLQHRLGHACTTPGCLPYMQALLHTSTHVLDARKFLQQTLPTFQSVQAQAIEVQNRKEILDRFRFDLRFGFQGGRGFDIIQHALLEFLAPATLPSPAGIRPRNKNREAMLWDEAQMKKEEHLNRLLAPTVSIGQGILRNIHREKNMRTHALHPLQFVTAVNAEQKRAVEDIVYGHHGQVPYIIEGPAGTGKSLCVCEAIVQVLRTNPDAKVLVCAPSDAACDVLAVRLLPLLQPNSLLRINWWSRKVESVRPELLSSCHMDSQGGVFSIPTLPQTRQVSVIVCQCFAAECLELVGPPGWTKNHFTHLFIDETSQAMECETMVPLAKVGNRCSIVFAGDPKQLGPTVRDPVAVKMGLGMSIQERLLKLQMYSFQNFCIMTRLVKNYRSNEALLTVPSSLFYGSTLQSLAPKEVADPFENYGDLPVGASRFPLLLCNVQGKERSKVDTPSFYNMEECQAIVSLAEGLLRCKCKEGVPALHTGQISVITPFRAQVLALRTVLRSSNLGGINVGVVEDFQGQEAKVVFISTVLTKDHKRWNRTAADDSDGDENVNRLGFLHDPKRFNVAITRAHALCVIVGHGDYLERSGTYWAALMDHIRRNDGVLRDSSDVDDDDKENECDDNVEDLYGVEDLLKRVEELRLLGCGAEDDTYDLSTYYSDVPQWKVMLS